MTIVTVMILSCIAIVIGLSYFVIAPELDPSVSTKEIKEAIDVQMQPLWTSVNGTAFDSEAGLDVKQERINDLSIWASKTADRKVRKAQEYWISVAQYTVDYERKERAKKVAANKLIPSLPPLPPRSR